MILSEQQPFCSRPFEWFEVHPDGSVFLCCPAWLKRSVGNLLQQSIDEIWNGPVAQEIRKSIINGSFHNCSRSRCPHLRNNSGPLCPPNHADENRATTALKTGTSRLDFLPTKLNLCFDYSCNLSCLSCRDQMLKAQGEELQRAEKISTILLKGLIPEASCITLSGFGDPFGSPTYLALLRKLNQTDFPQLQQVRLHTNGQRLTEKMWHSLPKLQPLVSEIEVSIDAASEATYLLNRPGGDYSLLLRNLDFLAGVDTKLTLSMVVQENNWREIPLLIGLARSCKADLYLSQLVNWGTFSRSDFAQRAVHLAGHPNHQTFRGLLKTIQGRNGVKLGNLSTILN